MVGLSGECKGTAVAYGIDIGAELSIGMELVIVVVAGTKDTAGAIGMLFLFFFFFFFFFQSKTSFFSFSSLVGALWSGAVR